MARSLTRFFRSANPARLGVYLLALWKLFKHPATPRGVRWLAAGVLAYAVSPIDLIPDFIPVIGMLDDVILVPLGLALVVRLAPPEVWQECLRQAEAGGDALPRLIWGAIAIVIFWLGVGGLVAGGAWWLLR
jgi:uncharacterized membrane protein YkvA (DUF1232 family)